MPRRIVLSPDAAWRSLISSMRMSSSFSRTAAFEADAEQLLRLDRELHRQLLEDFLAEAVDDHVHRVLGRDAALLAVEDLVLADLRRRGLVLDLRRRSS